MASGLLGLATAFVAAWATEACAAASRLGLLPTTTSPRAATEEATPSSHTSEIERRGVLLTPACAERADGGPLTVSTDSRGYRRQLASSRRAISAATQPSIPVDAAWQAGCCLAGALSDALLLRFKVEVAAPKPGAACRFLHLDTQQQRVAERVRKAAGGLPCRLHEDTMLGGCRANANITG
eukprot:SM000089S23817  [mRNA]  locus=s89:125198:126172:- [translate_table: standard]